MADYARMSIPEVQDLNFIQYLIWRRDAFIHRLSQTEEGQKYLDNAWRMEQTDPDRVKLRKNRGRKEAPREGV